MLNCSGFRQLGHASRVAPSTMAGLCARLGRHALLFHQFHRPRGPLSEPLVIGGFESFEFSQYYPVWFHLGVGARSYFLYGFTDSELRRKGRMTAAQKRRRAELEACLGRPHPNSIELETAALLQLVAPEPQSLELRSDEHLAYPRALHRVPHLQVRHRVTPGSAPRTPPAMRLGLCERPLTLAEILGDRWFPSRVELPERLARYYWRHVRTRALPRQRRHRRRYAA